MTAKQILQKAYGTSTNFMTPTVLKVGKLDSHIAYEISQGEGMDRQPIFGVSFANDKGEKLPDLSGLFQSLEAAKAYRPSHRHDPSHNPASIPQASHT